jgi:hypothetical protein
MLGGMKGKLKKVRADCGFQPIPSQRRHLLSPFFPSPAILSTAPARQARVVLPTPRRLWSLTNPGSVDERMADRDEEHDHNASGGIEQGT